MIDDAGGAAATPRGAEDHDDPQAWRARLLQGLLLTMTAVFAGVGVSTLASRKFATDLELVFGVSGLLMLAISLSGRWLSYMVRTAALLGVSGLAALYALARCGYAPNAFVAFGFVTVMATLLLGVRGGVGSVLAISVGLCAIPALQGGGAITRVSGWERLLDSDDPENIWRVAANFLVLSMSSVVAISYLLRRGERLLLEKTRSLEQLAREQAEKESYRADLALREAAYRKAAELEILGRLSGSMAHDFNNALLVIFAAIEQFSRADLTPELSHAVEALRSAASQGASATRQLRAFGPHSPRSVSLIALGPAVRRMAALLARVLPSNIEVSLDVDDDVAIVADEGQIQRLLTNLVLNARDAMREGGRVTLRVKRSSAAEGPFALIEVEDDGAGMSEDVRQRLFEPFFTTKGGAGTGLGLASVRELVEAAHGSVSAKSELGVGSTLSVRWPLADAAPEVSAARSSKSHTLDGAGITVLVVDDDTQVRNLLARGLRNFGFTVLEAADGREGLLIARRHREPVHVMCADCVMPGIPLRELVAGYRAAFPAGRVVVCSGHALEESGFDPRTADRFMAKPFGIKELARCLHELYRMSPEAPRAVVLQSADVA